MAVAPSAPIRPATCAIQLPARHLRVEHQTGDRNHQQQERGEREEGVVRQGRTHAGRVIVHPREH